jgi:hypothetical protein
MKIENEKENINSGNAYGYWLVKEMGDRLQLYPIGASGDLLQRVCRSLLCYYHHHHLLCHKVQGCFLEEVGCGSSSCDAYRGVSTAARRRR